MQFNILTKIKLSPNYLTLKKQLYSNYSPKIKEALALQLVWKCSQLYFWLLTKGGIVVPKDYTNKIHLVNKTHRITVRPFIKYCNTEKGRFWDFKQTCCNTPDTKEQICLKHRDSECIFQSVQCLFVPRKVTKKVLKIWWNYFSFLMASLNNGQLLLMRDLFRCEILHLKNDLPMQIDSLDHNLNLNRTHWNHRCWFTVAVQVRGRRILCILGWYVL